jgi:putative tryptophan/tyrosine transport system substrate-binding protein
MNRRDVIALSGPILAVAVAPFAWAQQLRKARIAYVAPARNQRLADAFVAGLRDLGYEVGRTISIDYVFADEHARSLDDAAAAVVTSSPDVVVIVGASAVTALKRATSTIPIVFAPVGDPVTAGIVPSLAFPQGNVTGVSLLASELNIKRVEVFREAIPTLTRVAVLWNGRNPNHAVYSKELHRDVVDPRMVLRPFMLNGLTELEAIFEAIKREGFDGVIVPPDAAFDTARARIVALATEHRLPVMYEHRGFVDAGGLMSYGPNIDRMSYRAAAYVDKILKGAKPSELPIEQPTQFELVINQKTARALSINFSAVFLARADEVIE